MEYVYIPFDDYRILSKKSLILDHIGKGQREWLQLTYYSASVSCLQPDLYAQSPTFDEVEVSTTKNKKLTK